MWQKIVGIKGKNLLVVQNYTKDIHEIEYMYIVTPKIWCENLIMYKVSVLCL